MYWLFIWMSPGVSASGHCTHGIRRCICTFHYHGLLHRRNCHPAIVEDAIKSDVGDCNKSLFYLHMELAPILHLTTFTFSVLIPDLEPRRAWLGNRGIPGQGGSDFKRSTH
jgi:hypothetical protein